MLRFFSWIISRLSKREAYGVEAALRARLRGYGGGVKIGRNVSIVGRENVTIGPRVALWGDSLINAAATGGSVTIGEDSHIDHHCVLYGQGGISIGCKCAIAAGVIIYSQTNVVGSAGEWIADNPVEYAPVKIGDGVWIGAHATILPGVVIGDHAVIGAGAVVRNDVPSRATAVGVPARLIQERRSDS